FMKLLWRGGRAGDALRLMNEGGFFARLIPEFARVRFLVEHDLYHHYTLAENTFPAVGTLDAFHKKQERHAPRPRSGVERGKEPGAALSGLTAARHRQRPQSWACRARDQAGRESLRAAAAQGV